MASSRRSPPSVWATRRASDKKQTFRNRSNYSTAIGAAPTLDHRQGAAICFPHFDLCRLGRALHAGWHPPAEIIDLDLIRLARVLHSFGETIGIEVGTRADILKRLEVRS